MTSEPIRDPITDHLLTPENSALIVIDYQPTQVNSIRSMDQDALVENVVRLARTAVAYRLPIVLSTVNVATGKNVADGRSPPGGAPDNRAARPDDGSTRGRTSSSSVRSRGPAAGNS